MRSSFAAVLVALPFAAASLGAGPAVAAPQALAVATQGEVPLLCEFGLCKAEISTICLQPDLSSPHKGTRYGVLADDLAAGRLAVVGRSTAGGEVIAAPELVTFAAERGHVSVKVTVLERDLAAAGLAGVALRIVGPAVLAPIEKGEATAALSALRPIADRVLGANGAKQVAAALSLAMAGALPTDRAAGPGEFERAWRKALAAASGEATLPAAGLKRASSAIDLCGELQKLGRPNPSFCMGRVHDTIMDEINQDYWDALDHGS